MVEKKEKTGFPIKRHEADLCVVGGGLSGMCAAIAAARRGIKVVLMQDRPVLGGNASSEIRMWIRGAGGKDMRETGIMEELALENIYRNPNMNFSIWDSILWEKVKEEDNITLLLNCSCMDAVMNGDKIGSITGWQTTSQTFHRVEATFYADCSGDSVLAPLTGAVYRVGREGRDEFQENIAPEKGDLKTMGLSCLMQARDTRKPVTFIAPKWARRYTKEDFPYRLKLSSKKAWTDDNFWWMEIGGTQDTIHDTEEIRDELIRIAYGVWDFIKNGNEVDADTWDLEWMGFLPGKRESRRYVGDYIMTQHDVEAKGQFEDLIAYGGWTMDDHDPDGFHTREVPTIWHPAPSPYGIAYRCLYSVNIENLFFAGRNISVTHTAMSSTRVMATCAMLGHAVGNAAVIAVREKTTPRGVYNRHMNELKQSLMEDGNYLPWNRLEPSWIMKGASISSDGKDAGILIDGLERRVDGVDHAWVGEMNQEVVIELPKAEQASYLRLVFDSDLNREEWKEQKWYVKSYPMVCNRFMDDQAVTVPPTIVKEFEVWVDYGNGVWVMETKITDNYQRMVKIPLNKIVKRVKMIPQETWGSKLVRIYSMELR